MRMKPSTHVFTEKYIVLEKQVGETPLAAVEAFRARANIATDVPLAYAGRLDPLASGALLVLIGEECKKQSSYHALDKEYEFEVLLSYASDTGDVLGLAEHRAPAHIPTQKEITTVLASLIGTHKLPYPHYSSKTVHGKPLFLWTLEGRLNEIEIPTVDTTIYKLKLIDIYSRSKDELAQCIEEKISSIPEVTDENKKLGADFRRTDIRARWKEIFTHIPDAERVTILRIRCTSASGAYMRTLAGAIGEKLGSQGLALSIHRTKMGRYWHLPFLPQVGFWRRKL